MNPPICHLSTAGDCLAVMTTHDGDDIYESGGLKYAAMSWCDHMLSAINEDGRGNQLVFQNHAIINKLTNFVSRSFDSWLNSIIFHVEAYNIFRTLDSLLSVLKVRFLPHTLLQSDLFTEVICMPTKHDIADPKYQCLCKGISFDSFLE